MRALLLLAIAIVLILPLAVAVAVAERFALQFSARLIFRLSQGRDVRVLALWPLYALKDPGYRLRRQMNLIAERTSADDCITVHHKDMLAYGVGTTLDEAVANFEPMLIDRFEEFKGNEDRLADALKAELASMRRYIAVKESR